VADIGYTKFAPFMNMKGDGKSMTATQDWRSVTIVDLFSHQVQRRPDARAVKYRGQELTYAGLDDAASRLAAQLQAVGVSAETVVGVMMERSLEMIVALVAILKAGGAYLPMRPDDPAERLRYMLEQAKARVVLADPGLVRQLPDVGATVVPLDGDVLGAMPRQAPLPWPACPSSLAYVCYTSGSTGQPKGVLVPHQGVTRLVADGDFADLGPGQTFLQLCSLTFDPATFEIWGPLLNGGCLVVYPPGRLSLPELSACLRRDGVTTLWLTTGLFHRMVDTELEGFGGLQQLLAGGDVLSPARINRVRQEYPQIRLVNGYGPTENTTFTTCHTVSDLTEDRVPIGRPITGTRVYVLDDLLRPVHDQEWGSLYTAGAGLARGYLSRPAQTAERFLPDPFHPGERMYRTGDVARVTADGILEFGGRSDNQVKVGGYRVEPGEIEAMLAGLAGVKEAVVIARSDTPGEDKVLVAYVVPEGGDEDLLPRLRLALHHRLPRHMIPKFIVLLDEFPLTRNDKVDRDALPVPEQSPREVDTLYAEPRTPTEALLADLWADALGVQEVGIDDNFFELGGNSLLAADLLARIRTVLSAEVPAARLFFENATVTGLAELVDLGTADGSESADASTRIETA
jgi:amino acid adenylation domain-containing protein